MTERLYLTFTTHIRKHKYQEFELPNRPYSLTYNAIKFKITAIVTQKTEKRIIKSSQEKQIRKLIKIKKINKNYQTMKEYLIKNNVSF